jgi:hypothetical protein
MAALPRLSLRAGLVRRRRMPAFPGISPQLISQKDKRKIRADKRLKKIPPIGYVSPVRNAAALPLRGIF